MVTSLYTFLLLYTSVIVTTVTLSYQAAYLPLYILVWHIVATVTTVSYTQSIITFGPYLATYEVMLFM